MSGLKNIREIISRYDEKITEYCDTTNLYGLKNIDSISRRGYCGNINIDYFLKGLLDEKILECIVIQRDVPIVNIDIYKHKNYDIYFKRLCICTTRCSSSSCDTNKTRQFCNGHHVIIVSSNSTINIDETNDYVIDFTYKQMLYSYQEENKEIYISEIKKLPNYLFVKFNDYINYSDKKRWVDNIKDPCKFIINMNDNLCYKSETTGGYLKYEKKYLKYKKKYIIAKQIYLKKV